MFSQLPQVRERVRSINRISVLFKLQRAFINLLASGLDLFSCIVLDVQNKCFCIYLKNAWLFFQFVSLNLWGWNVVPPYLICFQWPWNINERPRNVLKIESKFGFSRENKRLIHMQSIFVHPFLHLLFCLILMAKSIFYSWGFKNMRLFLEFLDFARKSLYFMQCLFCTGITRFLKGWGIGN